LPLPAIDGGRILLALIELVRRKALPPEKEGIVHLVGVIMFLIIAILIFFKDILRLFV
jgi:regulator of sigma E protease